MAHPVVSSGAVQIPALVSQHTDVVSGKEPKPQKEKKPKTAPVSQFPLEVRSTIIALGRNSYVFSSAPTTPGFLRASYQDL